MKSERSAGVIADPQHFYRETGRLSAAAIRAQPGTARTYAFSGTRTYHDVRRPEDPGRSCCAPAACCASRYCELSSVSKCPRIRRETDVGRLVHNDRRQRQRKRRPSSDHRLHSHIYRRFRNAFLVASAIVRSTRVNGGGQKEYADPSRRVLQKLSPGRGTQAVSVRQFSGSPEWRVLRRVAYISAPAF